MKKKKGKRKGWIITLSSIFGLILTIIIVGQITVYPLIWTMRTLINLSGSPIKIGPYEEQIRDINQSDVIPIKVDGYPDASIIIFNQKQVEENQPVILLIHGGGWSLGNAIGMAPFAKLLASNGYVVASLEYSLAPEHTYPTSTVQAIEALNYLYEYADAYHIDHRNIFVAGNSAGAHLSSQVGLIVSNPDYANQVGIAVRFPEASLRGVILYNGVYNFDTVGTSGFPTVNQLIWSYTGVKNYRSYSRLDEMSTVKHINNRYPTTFITVGDGDTLEYQTIEFINTLERNNINFTSLLWTGTNKKLPHDYIYDLNKTESQTAYERVIEFITLNTLN